jgi:crotonobetaine/carnitine-CoA ligase
MMSGYYHDPSATIAAWSDLWYHTGDIAFLDGGGNVHLIGRMSDSIRRGGENVSAQELEAIVARHPAVREVAAYGVPAELGEEDIKVDVVPVEGAPALDLAELVTFITEQVPRFMVPRYIELRESLPKTPSQRVEKYRLKAEGVTSRAVDVSKMLGLRAPRAS